MLVRIDRGLRFRDIAQRAHIGKGFIAEPVRGVLARTREIREVNNLSFPVRDKGIGADFISSARANETAKTRNVVGIEKIDVVVGVIRCSEECTLGVVVGILITAEAELLEVVEATDAAGFFLRLRPCRHEKTRKYRNNGNNHQQLNERKRLSCPND